MRSAADYRTGVLTGGHESYFISLYLLAIIVASILFSRRTTFLVAALSFVLLGASVELVYYHVLPRTAVDMPSADSLQTWILSNMCAFLAVAYLSSLLTQSLRRQTAELEIKQGELQDLQAFNEDIIHSMRGGLDHHRSRREDHAAQPHRAGNHGIPLRTGARGRCSVR